MSNLKQHKGIFNSIFWVKYSVFIFIIIAVIAYTLRANDPALDGLEPYLLNNENINIYTGMVKNYHIVNTRYVSGTEEVKKYNEYKIKVVGEDKTITIKVRAEFVDNKNVWLYSIVRFYNH